MLRRRQTLRANERLTPEVINGILAKRALLRAGVAPSQGEIISSNEPQVYVYCSHTWLMWSDSATKQHTYTINYEDSACLTMLASEHVLRQDWDSPEEDEAWANL